MINKDDSELILSTSPRIAKYSSNVVIRGLNLAKELTQNIAKDPTNISFYCSHVFESPHGDTSDFGLSPDGKTIVIVDKWGTINIFDLQNNRLLHQPFNCYIGDFSSETNGLNFRVQIASDSKTLIVFGSGGLKLWDIETGQLLKSLSDKKHTSDKEDFFTDSKTEIIAFIKDTAVEVWDLTRRIHIRSLEVGDSIDSFALSSDGRYVVTSSESYCSDNNEEDIEETEEDVEEEEYLEQQTICVWDISTGTILANFHSHEYTLYKDRDSIIISPDNYTLVTLNIESDFDSDSHLFTTKVWDLQTGKLRYTLPNTISTGSEAFDVYITNDSNNLVSLEIKLVDAIQEMYVVNLKLWDLVTGQFLYDYQTVEFYNCGLQLLGYFIYGSNHRLTFCSLNTGAMQIWDTNDGKLIKSIGYEEHNVYKLFGALSLSPDRQLLVGTCHDTEETILEPFAGELIQSLGYDSSCSLEYPIKFRADSKAFAKLIHI